MAGLLLGGLALAGINSSTKNKKQKTNNKTLDRMYNSTMSDHMTNIEQKQAKNLVRSIKENKPEYFSQFDELRFDNFSTPVSQSESHQTVTGIDTRLQRNLDLMNGYSNLQDNLDYGVITREKFTHNNMTPNTSKRDYTIDDERGSRKLENFTGINELYIKKKEKYNLFEPMKDLTYVNGMPVMTDYLDDRYLASNKNNMGNLPFETKVKIRPGIDGENRQGLGTVYRVNPRTTDDLRAENNQKISYENKPLETIKKGDQRAMDYNLTKFKLANDKDVYTTNVLGGKANTEAYRVTGDYTDINTQRGDNEYNYQGPANDSRRGEAPSKSKTKFEPSKKMENYNDPTHAVSGVNIRPVLQNKNSFVNFETQRATLDGFQQGYAFDNNSGSYVLDPLNVPITTSRELMLHADTNLGVNTKQTTYFFSNDYVLPTTTREMTSHNNVIGIKSGNNTSVIYPTDNAKTTTKELLLGYKGGFANPQDKAPIIRLTDNAKQTIKETTLKYQGGVANPQDKAPIVSLTDNAKQTIKETTLKYQGGFANPKERAPVTTLTDATKTTIKQTNLNYKGGFANPTERAPVTTLTDATKTTIKQTNLHCRDGFINPKEKGQMTKITDNIKPTIKQTNLFYKGGFINSSFTNNVIPTDKAKLTIKQTTENNNFTGPVYGTNDYTGYTRDENDQAKPTIKQTTENNNHKGPIYSIDEYTSYARDDNDIAKPTIKQTTENNNYKGPIYSTNDHTSYSRDENDTAKPTIKQTTEYNNYVGHIKGEIDNQISHMATDNIVIDDRREQTTFNRPANGGDNVAGPQINKKSVKVNCKKPSIFYVTNPVKRFDQSIMPSRIKPVFDNNKLDLYKDDYHVNKVFIESVKDNPLFINRN